MPTNPVSSNDVIQSHEHAKLSPEEIAKAVARHNRQHKSTPKATQGQNPKGEHKKSGKR